VRITLDPDQRAIVDQMHADTSGGHLTASELGTGKTLLASTYIVESGAQVSLVICPKGTRGGWERGLRNVGYAGEINRIEQGRVGAANYDRLLKGVPGVYLIGREYFRSKKNWSKVKVDVAVYDEIHAAQNRQSQMFRVLKTLQKTGYKIALSGTPSRNKFQGMWAPCRWLWPTEVDNSFWRWAAEFCNTEHDPFAGIKVTSEKVPGRFVSTLPSYSRLESKIDKPNKEHRYVEMTPAQRKAYKEMEEHLVTWLDDNPMVAEMPITMRIRLRQIALGMPTFTEDGSIGFAEDCASPKIDALKEIISDLDDDEPVLILTDSQRFAEVVVKRLGSSAREWSGKVSHKDREGLLQGFQEGKFRFLVATIASIGEGTDGLQDVCNTEVWLSYSEDRVLNEQAAARLARRGQKRPVRSIDILTENSYDLGIVNQQIEDRLKMRASLKKEVVNA
jgi:SNF2 family DNA or RNA helicase